MILEFLGFLIFGSMLIYIGYSWGYSEGRRFEYGQCMIKKVYNSSEQTITEESE